MRACLGPEVKALFDAHRGDDAFLDVDEAQRFDVALDKSLEFFK